MLIGETFTVFAPATPYIYIFEHKIVWSKNSMRIFYPFLNFAVKVGDLGMLRSDPSSKSVDAKQFGVRS